MNAPAISKILFVCMGNICRSPAAEGVMRRKIAEAGLAARIQVDSAGTGGWHAGNRADQRMRSAAAARGYDLTSIARQVCPQDFTDFDVVLIMDEQNQRDLRVFDPHGRHAAKVRFFCEFCTEHEATEVPDPYYGGAEGFDQVLNLLEDGCANLLLHVTAQQPVR
jgi:protein-tyrosine phosphatase